MEGASAADILMLRNLTFSSFATVGEFWSTLRTRIKHATFDPEHDRTFVGLIADALDERQASASWRTAVIGGLRDLAASRGPGIATAIWRWIEVDGQVVACLLATLGVSGALERYLADAAPRNLAPETAEPLLRFATEERLHLLHAAIAAALYSPAEAVALQIKIEAPQSDAGFEVILKRAAPKDVVDLALQQAEPRLARFAAAAVASKPDLLRQQDLSDLRMQKIWARAMDINPEAWRGPSAPEVAFHRLLTDLIGGKPADMTLVAKLAATSIGDLESFEGRTKLWPILSDETRQALFSATIDGWLEKAGSGQIPFALDNVLMEAASREPRLSTLLEGPALNIIQALQIFTMLRNLDEPRFRLWLSGILNRLQAIATNDADAIGRLIQERRWSGAADDLLRCFRRARDDLKTALRACISLISLWDRWLSHISPLSSLEKWDLLADLAAELYPYGPDQDGLWERAGGKGSDLNRNGSGGARWHEALRQVRLGKPPRISKLLGEMGKDYGQNPHLRSLASDYEFR